MHRLNYPVHFFFGLKKTTCLVPGGIPQQNLFNPRNHILLHHILAPLDCVHMLLITPA